MRAIAMAALMLAARHAVDAQGAPSTDVWLVSMREEGARVTFGTPRNATRRTGYDNQPSFTPAGDAVLYTAIGADSQADTWRFSVPDGSPVRVTETPESEYSPTVTPDRRTFSVVRVERDSTQRLWRFALDGRATPAVILPGVKPVGYHVWVDNRTIVLYVLGQPATLQVADVATGAATVVARDIGRALVRVPRRNAITFAQLVRDSMPSAPGAGRLGTPPAAAVFITELDVRARAVKRLAPAPRGADYHVWTPRGTLLAASGSTMFRWTGLAWEAVGDFSGHGVRSVSRLAVSPRGDWLAFVAEDTPQR